MGSLSLLDRPRIQSEVVDQKILGDSIKLPASGLVAPSRFMKGAMTERLASWDQHVLEKRGIPSDALIKLYEEWGKGGFGIILTGNTMVNPVDLEAPANPIVHKPFETPERVGAFRRQAEAAKAHGSLVIIQLSHGGRQVGKHLQPNPISASDVQLGDTFGMSFAKPRAMTLKDIDDVIDQFAYGAEFAHKTGYHGVQLHAAHGYLLAQFLATTTNRRTDEYGGPLENRARIIYRIVEEIKRRITDPKFAVGIKINSAEFQQGGFQPEECRDVCRHLEQLGLDFVELSGGTYEELAFKKRESTGKREAFFLEFADVVRPALKIPVFVTGGFRTASAMIRAIHNGSTDGIGLARPVCEEPHLPKHLISGEYHAKVDSKIDYDDFGIWLNLAGTQMRMVGFGLPTVDSTNEEVVKEYTAEIERFSKGTGKQMSEGVVVSGHPTFGSPLLPWEQAY